MGMFDYVNVTGLGLKCWNCRHLFDGEKDLQTKDLNCELSAVSPYRQGLINMYAPCPKCDAWNEFERIIPADAPWVQKRRAD